MKLTKFVILQKVNVFFFNPIFHLPSCPLNGLKIQIPHPKWKLAPKYLHMQARRARPDPLEPFLPFQHYNVNFSEQTTSPSAGGGKELSVSVHEQLHFGRVITVGGKPGCTQHSWVWKGGVYGWKRGFQGFGQCSFPAALWSSEGKEACVFHNAWNVDSMCMCNVINAKQHSFSRAQSEDVPSLSL